MMAMGIFCAFVIRPCPAPAATVVEHFDNYSSGVRPTGWSFSCCNSNTDVFTASGWYGASSPALRMNPNAEVVTPYLESITSVSFGMRGTGSTGGGGSEWLDIIADYEGGTYPVASFECASPNFWTTRTFTNSSATTTWKRLHFAFHGGMGLPMAVDDIELSYDPVPQPTIPAPASPTATPWAPAPTPAPSATTPPSPVIIEHFDRFDSGVRPVGWIFENCDSDKDVFTDAGCYGESAPSLRLNPESVCTAPLMASVQGFAFGYRGFGDVDLDTLQIEAQDGDGFWFVCQAKPVGNPYWMSFQVPIDTSSTTFKRLRFRYESQSDQPLALDDVTIWGQPAVPASTPATYYQSSGDYDGDGTSDIAHFNPRNNLWAIRDLTRFSFGTAGDLPICGDYDGDLRTDVGVYRPREGQWLIRDITRFYFGSSDDVPQPQYWGRSRETLCPAIFRPSDGLWAVRDLTRFYWGGKKGDVPVAESYGGGRAQAAIFHPSSGAWRVRNGTTSYWGMSGDIPIPMDYDFDGRTDIGVYRPSMSGWLISMSGGGKLAQRLGAPGDMPVAGHFLGWYGAGYSPRAVYTAKGEWVVKDITRFYFGDPCGRPVTGGVRVR